MLGARIQRTHNTLQRWTSFVHDPDRFTKLSALNGKVLAAKHRILPKSLSATSIRLIAGVPREFAYLLARWPAVALFVQPATFSATYPDRS